MERDSVSALTAAVLLVVQASGEISVHVLVHAHFDISPGRAFAPSRALKGPHPLPNTLRIADRADHDGGCLARSPPSGTIYK